VAGATIELQGNNIVVELPGVKDASKAISVIGETAQLEFRPVVEDSSGTEEIFAGAGPSATATAAPPTTTAPAPSTTASPSTTTAPASPSTTAAGLGRAKVAAAAMTPALLAPRPVGQTTPTTAAAPSSTAATSETIAPTTATTAPATASDGPALTTAQELQAPDIFDQTIVVPQCTSTTNCNGDNITARYVLGPVLKDGSDYLTGKIVSSASAALDSTGQWEVNVTFTGKGGGEWDAIVGKQYYQKYVAIVLDNQVISAPQINAQQFNGQATISGGGTAGFTHSQASQLSLVLRYGALPVQLNQSDVQTISASLGKASLRAGLIAGFIGLALVLLYMIFYYRALGLVVVVGLGLSGTFLYCLYTYLGNSSSFNASLSLASVVGIIVSVGVTADSYIVYFERLKDDIRAGKSVRASVDKSFSRAWRTIWTADLVSIIAAVLLYILTIGDVRGFAFSLGLATMLDLITAYTFTRPMVSLLGRNRTIAEARVLGVSRGLAAAPAGGAA
jgi:preprotein translocase subunit SecD